MVTGPATAETTCYCSNDSVSLSALRLSQPSHSRAPPSVTNRPPLAHAGYLLGNPSARLRNLVHAFHQANVAEPDLPRILQYESIRGGERLKYVYQHYLVPVRGAVAPLVQSLVEQGRVRPFPIDVMVYAVVAMNSVNAEVPFVSLLGDTFAADPSGFARMLSDILLDGLVIDSETESG